MGHGLIRRRLRRHPLLWAALVALAAVLAVDRSPVPGLALLVPLLVIGALGGGRHWLAGGLVVAVLAGGLHRADLARRQVRELAAVHADGGDLTGRVLGPVRAYDWGWTSLLADERGGRVHARVRGGTAPETGARLRLRGRFEALPVPRNPGEFDVGRWLWREGVHARFDSPGPVEVLEPPPGWRLWGSSLRADFRERVTRGLDADSREAAVIRAVVLGERPRDQGWIEPFRLSGTLHLFAVSGLHVGMVGLLGWLLTGWLGIPRRWALWPVIALMFGYAWLTGLKPPAIRAAWMAAVFLGAFWFRRRPDMPNALGLAALLAALVDADLFFQPGVQLSFGVVLVIGLLAGRVRERLGFLMRDEPYLPRVLWSRWRERWFAVRRRLADWLGLSAAAWVGSAPLTAFHFGMFTPVAVLASTLMTALVFPLLAIALLSGLLGGLPGVPLWLNRVNGGLATLVFRTADGAAKVPGGHAVVPRGRPADEFLMVFDLGADGASCWHGSEGTLMIDGGGAGSFDRGLAESLDYLGLQPSAFVLSHPDGGHAGGLVAMLANDSLRQGLVPVLDARSEHFRALMESAGHHGVVLRRGREGLRYPLGGEVWLEVVAEPDPWNAGQRADARVMPLLLHWRGWRVLFVADGGWALERRLLREGKVPRADVIVAGRPLADGSLGDEFLEAVGARAIVAGHDDFPPEQAVPRAWRDACEARGIAVFHQGESGAVTLTLDDGRLRLRGFIDERQLELEPR